MPKRGKAGRKNESEPFLEKPASSVIGGIADSLLRISHKHAIFNPDSDESADLGGMIPCGESFSSIQRHLQFPAVKRADPENLARKFQNIVHAKMLSKIERLVQASL